MEKSTCSQYLTHDHHTHEKQDTHNTVVRTHNRTLLNKRAYIDHRYRELCQLRNVSRVAVLCNVIYAHKIVAQRYNFRTRGIFTPLQTSTNMTRLQNDGIADGDATTTVRVTYRTMRIIERHNMGRRKGVHADL